MCQICTATLPRQNHSARPHEAVRITAPGHTRLSGAVRPHEAVVRHQCVHVLKVAYSHTHMCATARRRVARAGAHPRLGLGDRAGIATKTIRLKSSNVRVQSCQKTTMGQTRCTTNNAVVTARCREQIRRGAEKKTTEKTTTTKVDKCGGGAHGKTNMRSHKCRRLVVRQLSAESATNEWRRWRKPICDHTNVDDPPSQNNDKRLAHLAKANVRPHKSRGFGRL